MATTTAFALETLAVTINMSDFSLRRDWLTLRTSSNMADMVALAATVTVPVGVLRIKKVVTTNEQVVEFIDLPIPEG